MAVLFLALAWAFPALAAYTAPPLVGHVVDVPGLLSASERSALDAKLDHARKTKGPAVVVLVVGPLDDKLVNSGQDPEDIGGLRQADRDNVTMGAHMPRTGTLVRLVRL